MIVRNINHIIFFLLFGALFMVMGACSTGIESTKTITLSKSDKKSLTPSPEDAVMEDVRPLPLSEWKPDMPFMISDNRAAVVFEGLYPDSVNALKGKTIYFKGVSSRITPGARQEAVIKFSDGDVSYNYATGKTPGDAARSISSMDVPMLIDMSLVERARERLTGMKLWTRSRLWYDKDGEKLAGRQFVPVTISDVNPGNMSFILSLDIIDENSNPAVIYMNIANSGLESRTFPDLFSISDPKLRYPSISPEVWTLITQGRVRIGMTKDECKLAIGNPTDVNSGHDWSQTLDLWRYDNGAYLQFQDGLLTSFRI